MENKNPKSVFNGNEAFVNKILNRNSSVGNTSLNYYRGMAGEVPFKWEEKPGKPKDLPKEEHHMEVYMKKEESVNSTVLNDFTCAKNQDQKRRGRPRKITKDIDSDINKKKKERHQSTDQDDEHEAEIFDQESLFCETQVEVEEAVVTSPFKRRRCRRKGTPRRAAF
ncbi:Sodium/calcium exchanger membrane region [Quillaja saponaria]|uniref:Sodium/calcium exchanger membrane region n=1 Tax=Quillaja saponaria TaxID=32244 RepID=A0AAD7LE82_QUISA|nr:Sodium/calcium exchanger membrane region [Quillaja saponaria]